MESWKKKITFWDRLKFAWKAFRLQRFGKTFPIVVHCGNLKQKYFPCDIGGVGSKEGCANNARHCLSRPTIIIGIQLEEHWHVCDDHATETKWLEQLDRKDMLDG